MSTVEREAIINAAYVQISLLVMTQILSPLVHHAKNATCPGDVSKRANANLTVPDNGNVPLQTIGSLQPNVLIRSIATSKIPICYYSPTV